MVHVRDILMSTTSKTHLIQKNTVKAAFNVLLISPLFALMDHVLKNHLSVNPFHNVYKDKYDVSIEHVLILKKSVKILSINVL